MYSLRLKKLVSILLLILTHGVLSAGQITLVRSFETWNGGIIKSTDPAGITYHPPSGHLFISDSEINELPVWNNENIFEISLLGNQVFNTYDAIPPTGDREPTGITFNSFDGFFYVSDDNHQMVMRYNNSFGTPIASVVTTIAVPSATDPEDVTSDPNTGNLYVADGVGGGVQVLVYNSNLVFLNSFSVSDHVGDPEGIAYSTMNNTLFIVSSPDLAVFEYTLDGIFLDEYDISGFSPTPISPQGLTFAPSSDPTDDPNNLNLYIVDGQIDNNQQSSERDGLVYEAHVSLLAGPIVSNIPDQSILGGQSFATISLDNYVDDPDNSDAQIMWSYTGNTELNVSIDVNRVATITTPTPQWTGSETITFTATDPTFLFDSDNATFTVTSADPDIVVNPTIINFGLTLLNDLSDVPFPITNIGASLLTVSNVSTTNGVFSVVSPSTPFDVAPSGGTQDVTIRFSPITEGVDTGSVHITSNDPDEGTATVSLTGEGTTSLPAVAMRINAGGGDYTDSNGDLFVADKVYTAGNFGFSSGASKSTTSVIAGTSDQLLYQTYRDGLNFSYMFDIPNGQYEITCYFMEPQATKSGKRVFDLSAEGVVVLNDFDIYPVAGLFTAHTESFTVSVSDGQLNFNFDHVSGPGNPLVCAVTVIGSGPPAPDISVTPDSIDFGDVIINESSEDTVTITNDGNANLEITGLSTTDTVFTVVSPVTPITITPQASASVIVRFSTSVSGVHSGALNIASDDPDESVVSVALAGNGVLPPPNEPDIAVSSTGLDFGLALVNDSSDALFTITNVGTMILTVSSLSTTNGVFSVVSPPTPFDVAPSGGSQQVTIRFSPVTETVDTGHVHITSNDPDEPLVGVSLTGQGVTELPTAALRINAGGGDYTDTSGDLFVADKVYTAGDFGYSGGVSKSTTSTIAGTSDQVLYQTYRDGLNFSYMFDLPNGQYNVTCYFMEPKAAKSGKRVFDLSAEGVVVLNDFDIFPLVGKFSALTQSFTVSVSDGQLNLNFDHVSGPGNPVVSAVTVVGQPQAMAHLSISDIKTLSLPEQVQLESPSNFLTIGVDSVVLIVRKSQLEVQRYWFELATDSTFANSIIDSTLADTSHIMLALANNDTYWWRARAYNVAGWGPFSEVRRFDITIASADGIDDLPQKFRLSQNYPNPFNPTTTITYELPQRAAVVLKIYNVLGQEVKTLVNAEERAGTNKVIWNSTNVASGVYFYRLQAGDFVAIKRLVITK